LPDNRVNCLALDKNQKLWIGTQYGLVTYDGFVWVDLSDSIPGYVVKDISVNIDGDVWIATNSGFCKYDSVWNYFFPSHQALSEQINCISFDKDNDPWFGTVNGLFSYKSGVFNFVLDTSSLENFINVKSIAFKGDSVVVGTVNGGIGFIYNGTCDWLNVSPIGGIIDNSFNELFVDSFNNIWGCSPYGGVQLLLSDGGWYFINTTSNPGWQSNSITSIEEGVLNKKYLGTKGGGIIVFEFGPGVFNNIVIDSSNSNLPDNFILDIVVDNNVVWAATQFEGLVEISSFLNSTNKSVSEVGFFPVPFKNKITFCLEGLGFLCVYNIEGKAVYKDVVLNNETIDFGFLDSGFYVFSIETKNKKTYKKTYKQ